MDVRDFTTHGCSGSHIENSGEMRPPYIIGDIYRGTGGDSVMEARRKAFEAVVEANSGRGTRTAGEIEYLQARASELAMRANEQVS